MDPAKTPVLAGVITRSGKEIERVLESLYAYGEPVFAVLDDGKLLFRSMLLSVDSKGGCIVVAASEDEALNTALLARPRAMFMSNLEELYLEFPAADPQRSMFLGKPAIRLSFPDVLVSHPRRAEPRSPAPERPPLKCIADAEGIAAFESLIVDIGSGGIGFLVYTAGITLEPGTILRGCRIEQPGKAPVIVDLEVRYSLPVTLADGRRGLRSGCRFVNPTNDLLKVISSFVGDKA